MGDGVHTPYKQHLACECDWTYHRGRTCPNPAVDTLCHLCRTTCTTERDDNQPRRVLSDADYDQQVRNSDDWSRLRTYLRTLGEAATTGRRVLAQMDDIKDRRTA